MFRNIYKLKLFDIVKNIYQPFKNNYPVVYYRTPAFAWMITKATIEGGDANYYVFCKPYTLSSMLPKC